MSLALIALILLQAGPEAEGRGRPASADSLDSRADSIEAPSDSTAVPAPFGGARQPSPTGAMLRSAVLPGWGQLYNDRPAKGIILGSAELGLLAWLLVEHSLAQGARDDYRRTGDPFYEDEYELHSARRLDLIWYTSAAWLYGILDAYVDAHLYGFHRENSDFVREVGDPEGGNGDDSGVGAVVYIRF